MSYKYLPKKGNLSHIPMYVLLSTENEKPNQHEFCKNSIVVIPIILITFFNLLLVFFLFIPAKFTERT